MIYTKPLKYDNCKDCIRTCEHAGKDREFCYSKDVSCKKTADKFDNIRKQYDIVIKNLKQENQRLHTELKKYKKALELIGKQYMSDMGMGKSIEEDSEYYEINLRNIIQTAIKQAGQEELTND